MLKWLDIPPTWLLAALAVAYLQPRSYGAGLTFGGPWADLVAGLLIGAGLLLMALALLEMRRHRTTPIPHMQATSLVTSGIFSRTRNPIYLGDSLLLLGFILRWESVLALPLVPLFVWVIERRFIQPEEDGLKRKFPAQFDAYAQQVRRWL